MHVEFSEADAAGGALHQESLQQATERNFFAEADEDALEAEPAGKACWRKKKIVGRRGACEDLREIIDNGHQDSEERSPRDYRWDIRFTLGPLQAVFGNMSFAEPGDEGQGNQQHYGVVHIVSQP